MKKPQKPNINTPAYWNKIYKDGINPAIKKLDAFKFVNIAHHIEDASDVIDLGCGDGTLAKTIKVLNPTCEVWGLDYSKEVINQLKLEDTGIGFTLGDVYKTGFQKEMFDYVLSTETIEHLDYPEKMVKEAHGILRKGGKFMLTCPHLNHIPSPEHVWDFDYDDIYELLEDFTDVWVFPWAAGWSEVKNSKTGEVVHPKGHWDTIMALAIK